VDRIANALMTNLENGTLPANVADNNVGTRPIENCHKCHKEIASFDAACSVCKKYVKYEKYVKYIKYVKYEKYVIFFEMSTIGTQ